MTKAQRILVAGLFHESHSFVAGVTRLDECAVLRGDEMWRECGGLSPLGGALETAREVGWDVVPAIDIRVMPGAVVEARVVEEWKRALEKIIRDEEKLDGVFLVLHGAMQSETCRDVEGEVLVWLREIIGWEIPIGGVTDLHANFSGAMAKCSNALVTYRQNPHADAKETAQRAAHLFDLILREELNTRTVLLAPPLLMAPPSTGTADQPMKTLEAMAREIESAHAEILAVNIHAGYAFADAPCTGVSFSAITTEATTSETITSGALQSLADYVWSQRASTPIYETSLADALVLARESLKCESSKTETFKNESGPVLLVEPSDNIGGGAPGDSTHILRTLLQENQRGENFYGGVILNDPQAVQALQDWAIGETRVLEVGGRSGVLSGGPVVLPAKLLSRSDGTFELEDPHSHLAAMSGRRIEMGLCAVVQSGSVIILLTSLKTPPFDLGQWRSQGIAPETLDIIGVKAAVAHRQAYDPIARAAFWVSTPGACASDLSAFPFRHLRRPIFPLDADTEFP